MSIVINTPVKVPPIKIQGIKTKLVPFISDSISWKGKGRWIEPFLGSGVVLFNIAPKTAIGSDTNKHIIELYAQIQKDTMTPKNVKAFLQKEGSKLESNGGYYYEVRDRFNSDSNAFDFLFLNRSCFNGLMRFNSKGKFNTPFCRNPQRFAQAYITKISNQVGWLGELFKGKRAWKLEVMDWRETVEDAKAGDFLYLDPPYYGRHTNYFDVWGESDMRDLAGFLASTKCRFALSLWYGNRYRKNPDIERYFSDFKIHKREHFYHVGSTEDLRNSMVEALITNRA